MGKTLHVGLLVNPLAGLGGGLALKGSDGEAVREIADSLQKGQTSRAAQRCRRSLDRIRSVKVSLQFSCWGGSMGEDVLREAGFDASVLGSPSDGLSDAGDTRDAAVSLQAANVDLLVFVGGDGTARDILDAVGSDTPVLGIPAGVKMHSGVFAVSPEAAGDLMVVLSRGGLVDLKRRDVRDIDEEAFRLDTVRSRFYGELLVPCEGSFLQQTKLGGREDQQLAAAEIAAWQVEKMEPDRTYLVGPGSTTAAIMEELRLPCTLLGVDVVRDGELLLADADEASLLSLIESSNGPFSMIVTVIGGQGHLFGRGNQQISPAVIRAVGSDNINIVASKSKIAGLASRPLLLDTNDPLLDRTLRGLIRVNTGYDDYVIYRVE
ncbi:ATP-NAD kinase family protein [Candidatus Marimicrobium litorale]|uniref:ATP-NAD kinase family protein n=1 Tax=Candidatus Marimicrobium litorale TaxID=2518991 RepID=UPI00243116D4|nr:ATP-NAD kinase family protein [Candidatus Marimicrobium litorale]